MLPILLGLGAGLVKNQMDKPEQARQRNLAATAAYYSPWSGMDAQSVGGLPKNGSLFNDLLQGAAIGSMFGGAGASPAPAGVQSAGQVAPATEQSSYWNQPYKMGGR